MNVIRNIILAAATAATAHAAVAQTKWDFPSGYSANSFQTQILQQFADTASKNSGGKLTMTVHSNGSLYKANEIKRAVQSGQVQIGEFILSGASNENPLYGVDSIPFLATSYAQSKKLWMASKPAIEKLLASQGLKLMYVSPWPGQSLYSVKAINSAADLRGTKMRTYNPATNRIAQLLGAQPATIQLAELGQALATGAVDDFLTSSASGIESKLYEQTKYFYPVNAWLPKNAIVVNQKAFDGLDKASQDALLKAAKAAEDSAWVISEQHDKEYVQGLAAHGMKVAEPSPELKKALDKIGETMTGQWLRTAGDEGKKIVDTYKGM